MVLYCNQLVSYFSNTSAKWFNNIQREDTMSRLVSYFSKTSAKRFNNIQREDTMWGVPDSWLLYLI